MSICFPVYGLTISATVFTLAMPVLSLDKRGGLIIFVMRVALNSNLYTDSPLAAFIRNVMCLLSVCLHTHKMCTGIPKGCSYVPMILNISCQTEYIFGS